MFYDLKYVCCTNYLLYLTCIDQCDSNGSLKLTTVANNMALNEQRSPQAANVSECDEVCRTL